MRTRKRLQWAALIAVPLLLGLVMWPVAVRRRERIRTQEATRDWQAELAKGMFYSQYLKAEVVQQLIARGADVNLRSRDNATMLHYAAYAPVAPHREQRSRDRVALIRFLLARGANVNARRSDGTTPLMFAVWSRNPEAVRVLLNHGAQVNLRGKGPISVGTHRTALTLARQDLQTLINSQSGCIVNVPAPPEELNLLTPRQERAIAPQLRNARLIIAMLKAAGARE